MISSRTFEVEVPVAHPVRPRRSSGPAVSVVVASTRSASLLGACLGSLVPQCARIGAELVVARSGDAIDIAGLARGYAGLRVVALPTGATIPQLRGAGMAMATGDIIALTEDNCIADPDWVDMLVSGATDDVDVVGGAIDNGRRERAMDWAAYFAEYGYCAATRPGNGEPAPKIAAANVAYSRRVVDQVVGWARSGEWENVVHDRLGRQGSAMRFMRTAAVYQNSRTEFWPFCRNRYDHGLAYAVSRLGEHPAASRLALLAASPLLPVLLTARIARASASGRWGAFVRALPATFAFLTAWSLGEAVGYLRGRSLPNEG